jgi:nitroreductase
MNIMLAATEHGLVARPMAGYDPEKVRESFNLDQDDDVMLMIAVGYPGDDESYLPDYYKGLNETKRTRKNPEEFVKRL